MNDKEIKKNNKMCVTCGGKEDCPLHNELYYQKCDQWISEKDYGEKLPKVSCIIPMPKVKPPKNIISGDGSGEALPNFSDEERECKVGTGLNDKNNYFCKKCGKPTPHCDCDIQPEREVNEKDFDLMSNAFEPLKYKYEWESFNRGWMECTKKIESALSDSEKEIAELRAELSVFAKLTRNYDKQVEELNQELEQLQKERDEAVRILNSWNDNESPYIETRGFLKLIEKETK